MFKDSYKSAMSQSVPDELLSRTAKLMEEARLRPEVEVSASQRPAIWTRARIVATAAAVVMVIFFTLGGHQLNQKNAIGSDFAASPQMYSEDTNDIAGPESKEAQIEDGAGSPTASAPGINKEDNGAATGNGYSPTRDSYYGSDSGEWDLEPISFQLPSSDESMKGIVSYTAQTASADNISWPEAITTDSMPVYRNTSVRDETGAPTGEEGMTADEMKSVAVWTAVAVGYNPSEMEEDYSYVESGGVQYCTSYSLLLQDSESPLVEVQRDGATAVLLTAVKSTDASMAEIEADPDGYRTMLEQDVLNTSAVHYSDLVGFDKTAVSSNLRYLEDEDTTSCNLVLYDQEKSPECQLLSYSFNSIRVSVSARSAVSARICYQAVSFKELVGYYPVLSSEEAEEQLYEGNYFTAFESAGQTVVPSSETVKGAELIYLTDGQLEYYQPVYRFLVEIPQEMLGASTGSRLNAYGYYYVPAVLSEYLSKAT